MMTFSSALEALKLGHIVARSGWNGKGMWITLGEGRSIPAYDFWNRNVREWANDQPHNVEVLPYLIMKTADDKILMGWLASQTDMLADDWEIVK